MEFLSIQYQAQIEATNHLSGEKSTFVCISNKLLARSFWIFLTSSRPHYSKKIQKQWKLNPSLPPLTGKPDLGEPKSSFHCYTSLSLQALDLPNETESPLAVTSISFAPLHKFIRPNVLKMLFSNEIIILNSKRPQGTVSMTQRDHVVLLFCWPSNEYEYFLQQLRTATVTTLCP